MPTRPPQHKQPGTSVSRQQYDRQRDTQAYRRWYKTARWQALRQRQLDDEPLCIMCKKAGRITVATVCDHRERHNGDYERFWSGPFQSLCASHHSSDKQRDEAIATHPDS